MIPRPATHTETPDPHLDAVLHALNAAQPSPGLNTRVFAALATASKNSSRPRTRFALLASFRSAFPVLTTAALAAAILLPFALRHALQSPHPAHLQPRQQQQPPSPLNSASLTPQQQSADTPNASSSPPQSMKLGPPPPIHLELTLTTPPPTDPDQQALLDLQTPSFPAPPLPPTPQERLVRLMLRRGEKQDLAQLDPDREPDLQRAETVAFRNFFEPPAPTQQDTASPPDKLSPTKAEKAPQP